MTEATAAPPDLVDELQTVGEARLESLKASLVTAPVVPTNTPEPVVVVDKAGAVAGDGGAGEPKAPTDTAITAPGEVPAPDLDWLPEKDRVKVSALDAETIATLKAGFLRHGDYTRKTQEVAKERDSLNGAKEKAALWERLEKNPAAADAAYKVLNGQSPGQAAAPVEDGVDLSTLSAPELKAYFRAQARDVAKEVAVEVVTEKTARDEAPRKTLEVVTNKVNDWATDKGLTEDTLKGALTLAAKHVASIPGLAWTPENAVALAELGLILLGGQKPAATTPAAKPAPGGLSKVASPIGRGSASVPVTLVPKSVQEHRVPKNDKERVELASHVLLEQFGVSATSEDIEAMFRR